MFDAHALSRHRCTFVLHLVYLLAWKIIVIMYFLCTAIVRSLLQNSALRSISAAMCKKHLKFNPALSSAPLQGVRATKRGLVDETMSASIALFPFSCHLTLSKQFQSAHTRAHGHTPRHTHFHSPSSEQFVVLTLQ